MSSAPFSLEDRFFTVEPDNTATRQHRIKMRVPKLHDRLQAQSVFPTQDNQVGYTEAEYLLAYCIEEINSQQVRQMPMDVIDRITGLPYQDLQSLMAIFGRFVTISSTEDVDNVKRISDALFASPTIETVIIPRENLPTGTVSITFQVPRMKDRIEAQKRYPGRREVGYSFEDYMFCHCVTHVNGELVLNLPAMDRLKDVFLLDFTWANEIFYRCSALSESAFKTAESVGKDMLMEIFSKNKKPSADFGTATTAARKSTNAGTATPRSSTEKPAPSQSIGTEPAAFIATSAQA